MNNIEQYANRYLQLGWVVLPCGNYQKYPIGKWREYQNPSIENWEKIPQLPEWKTATGIALITGRISGIVVVDYDDTKETEEFDSTVIAKTRSGGKHFYYRWTDEIRNTVRMNNAPIDFRGDGGLVIIPPSEAKGKQDDIGSYEWIKPPTPEALRDLPQVPDNVKRYLETDKTTKPMTTTDYAGISEGGRNDALHRAACKFCRITPQKDWDTAYMIIQGINNTFSPPLEDKEVKTIFDQACKFIASHPKAEKTNCQYYSEMDDEQMLRFEKRDRMPLGLISLDKKFDFPTGFYVICGNPGSGKGWFALWMARKFWEKHQRRTAFYSLEMPEILVRARLLQAWSNLTQEEFESGRDVTRAKTELKKDPIAVYQFGHDDLKYRTTENFIKDFKDHYEKGFRVFMFDHLHELQGATVNEKNQGVVEEWGHAFQKLAKDYPDVWLMVFAQPNSASANKKIITKNDMLGGKSITHKCEYFISLNRKLEEENGDINIEANNREVLFWVDKNRITSKQYFGSKLYFGEDGNYYENENQYKNLNSLYQSAIDIFGKEK